MHHKERKKKKKEGKGILNIVERVGMHKVKNKGEKNLWW